MIIADTSGLLASFNDREPQHDRVRRCLDSSTAPLVVSPYVLAELDYLIGTRIGVVAELAVLRELAGPAYELATCARRWALRAAALTGHRQPVTIGNQ